MAPSTRSTFRPSTLPRPIRACEANTIKRLSFFRAYDNRHEGENIRAIATAENITFRTANRWLQQRRELGSPAYRRLRKRSQHLGRASRISQEQCQMLVSPTRNPVRDQLYEAQIKYHKLNIKPRQLQRRLKACTNKGQRYKQAYIQKVLSVANKRKRLEYCQEHKDKSIDDFWQYVFFTDEAHIDPSSIRQGHILREQGHRYDTENIQQRPELLGVRIHCAAWCNWHQKAKRLEFYNDENDYIQRPKRPPKPRKTMYESQADYDMRILEWQATLSHEVEVKPKGNAMTQKYYTERLLPVYITAIQKARLQDTQDWLLQEDGDPSHGLKKPGLAQQLKDSNWIPNLVHPPQSPDLNPMEACWNILKQRVRYRVWTSIEELKNALQEEWSKITMAEVRKRISEMPNRCNLVLESGGGPVKSALW